ncbi:MAG: hypothetical protein ABIA63_12590, partial [bacterium]
MKKQKPLLFNYRGVYDDNLNHTTAYYAGINAGMHFREVTGGCATVIAGCDHRFSSPVLKHYTMLGLIDSGCKIYDVGQMPTSVVARITNKKGNGGCCITASHNPPVMNGIKFFESDGSVLQPEVEIALMEQTVKDSVEKPVPDPGTIEKNYRLYDSSKEINEYVDDVVEKIGDMLSLKVGVDCRFGMANDIIPVLLNRQKCSYEIVHSLKNTYFLDKNGDYLNPEPKVDNVSAVQSLISGKKLDIGLVFDGDADRSAAVDNLGNYIQDDYILIMHCLTYGPKQGIRTITVDSSLAVERALKDAEIDYKITPVGDPFAWKGICDNNAVFGG